MQHAGQLQIVDVVTLPGQDALILDAFDAGTDEPHSAVSVVMLCRSASLTPSMIDW